MLTAKDIHMMTVLRAAFCQQQVVVAVLLIDMGTFRITSAKTCAQKMYLPELLTCLYVNLANLDFALFPQEVAFTIVEEQRRVAATYTEVDVDGVAPFAIRIVGIDIEMTARGIDCSHHIEPTLVVADGGGIDAALLMHILNPNLRLACETGTNLLPMNQVFTVETGTPGKYWNVLFTR